MLALVLTAGCSQCGGARLHVRCGRRYKGLKETELNDKLVKVTGKLGKFKNVNKKAMDQFNQFTDQVPPRPLPVPLCVRGPAPRAVGHATSVRVSNANLCSSAAI
jgi:hypothetical protein